MNFIPKSRFHRLMPAAVALCVSATLFNARSALAGYADVWQDGDTLYIQGDDDVNKVTIVGAAGTQGKLAVYIHKDPWIYAGVEHIDIDLGHAGDTLQIAQVAIAGDLTISAGGGNDTVLIGGWQKYLANQIMGSVLITTDNGLDAVSVENTGVLGDVVIETGDHADQVVFGVPKASDWSYSGVATVGTLIIGSLHVSTGEGADWLRISKSILSVATIDTAAGRDLVIVGDLVDDDLGVMDGPVGDKEIDDFTSTGRDGGSRTGDRGFQTDTQLAKQTPPSVDLDELIVNTGADGDGLGINNIEVDVDTAIEMEDGNDELMIISSAFGGDFDAHGGHDNDTLWLSTSNDFESSPSFHSFEN